VLSTIALAQRLPADEHFERHYVCPQANHFVPNSAVLILSMQDSSVLIRWGQRLLAENGANISIDGDFGPSTCLALNITLGRDKSSVCGNTFQKNDILELVALK